MIVKIKELLLEYRTGAGTFPVLEIPEWTIGAQEQVVIFGPSGSGKSTLLNIIAGLLQPTGGSVEVCGCELFGMSESQRDKFRGCNLSYIFQSFNLLQGYTALENVLIGATFSPGTTPNRNQAMRLLERVGLAHRHHHYPAQMSIGEQQRVTIARALVKKPRLILADEPTGSLDPHHSGEVVRLLRDACREHNCALVVVSHETGIAREFERQIDFRQLNRAQADGGGK